MKQIFLTLVNNWSIPSKKGC